MAISNVSNKQSELNNTIHYKVGDTVYFLIFSYNGIKKDTATVYKVFNDNVAIGTEKGPFLLSENKTEYANIYGDNIKIFMTEKECDNYMFRINAIASTKEYILNSWPDLSFAERNDILNGFVDKPGTAIPEILNSCTDFELQDLYTFLKIREERLNS